MRHARADALDRLEPLLVSLRALPQLKEKSRGTFYRGSKAFLHFHEDPAGLFVDIRLAEDFERFRATTKAEQSALLRRVKARLAAP
ncbi:MAG TPA: hypothetical protein VGZ52_12085 [Acidimicrobiales bacterium]|nr:hypothetical protein [Acidimicrobiales bacterium]